MPTRDIIVIGGSAGGIDALRELTQRLPAALPAAVLVVIHSHPSSPGYLPEILSRGGPLPVRHAANDEPLMPGQIYVAPPDRHLVIERDRMRLTHGPKENRSRPAVDPLFRSAAYFHGPRVIGVVLSGMLDDGTAGLWAIKDRGGLAVVQSPDEAQFRSMPASALSQVDVDYQARAAEIGPLLGRLARQPVAAAQQDTASPRLKAETTIALGGDAMQSGVLDLGELSVFSCPECHGVMVQLHEGGLLRFRCHTGHAYSSASLLAALDESIEDSLWSTMRAVEERSMLLRHMAEHLAHAGDSAAAADFVARADEADAQARQVRRLATRHPNLGGGAAPGP